MTYRRGASLTTAATLGYAETADQGPTAGNGFQDRWPDELAALHEIGMTDVRITLDWARLQPRPGALDAEWAELFEQIVRGADAIGLRPWACLHDGLVPRWFDDDGGLDDDEAFTTWWPRWVERAADRFGDLVSGWVPFACLPGGAPDQPWIDTWGILGGGSPVVAAVDLRDRTDTIGRYVGRMDLLGAVLAVDWPNDTDPSDADLARAGDRWGGEVREAADDVDSPLVVTGFSAGHDDADTAAEIVETLYRALDDAVTDGVPIEVAFIDPST